MSRPDPPEPPPEAPGAGRSEGGGGAAHGGGASHAGDCLREASDAAGAGVRVRASEGASGGVPREVWTRGEPPMRAPRVRVPAAASTAPKRRRTGARGNAPLGLPGARYGPSAAGRGQELRGRPF